LWRSYTSLAPSYCNVYWVLQFIHSVIKGDWKGCYFNLTFTFLFSYEKAAMLYNWSGKKRSVELDVLWFDKKLNEAYHKNCSPTPSTTFLSIYIQVTHVSCHFCLVVNCMFAVQCTYMSMSARGSLDKTVTKCLILVSERKYGLHHLFLCWFQLRAGYYRFW